MKTQQKIMIFRFSAMGDVAMTVPVIKALRYAYPNVKIIMVSRSFYAPMFRNIDRLTFVGIDFKNDYKGLWGLYRLYHKLKKFEPTAIADLHDVLRTKILRLFFKIAGYKIAVIDKGRSEKKALTRSKNKIFKPLKSTHRRYADVFRELDYIIDLEDFKPKKPSLSNQVSLFLKTFEGKKLIGIAPFAAHKGKQYPIDKIKEVIKGLRTQLPDAGILLFGGGKQEKIELDKLEVIDRNHIVNTAGIFGFDEELQLISKLDIMLSMDSGNAHLAALYGVPVLNIWGATHPYAGFAPINQPTQNQIVADTKKFPQLPTSIYGNKTFENFEKVWETIKAEQIVDKIVDILS